MDLIGSLVSQLGVDRGAAEGAAGGVLSAIREHAPGPDTDAVLAKVPEADGWIAKARSAVSGAGQGGVGGLGGALGALGGGGGGVGSDESAGGGLGAALGGMGGALGGAAGAAGLTSILGKLGIGGDKLGTLLPLVVQFLQARAGNDLVGKVLARVPFLDQGGGGLGSALGGLLGGR